MKQTKFICEEVDEQQKTASDRTYIEQFESY